MESSKCETLDPWTTPFGSSCGVDGSASKRLNERGGKLNWIGEASEDEEMELFIDDGALRAKLLRERERESLVFVALLCFWRSLRVMRPLCNPPRNGLCGPG